MGVKPIRQMREHTTSRLCVSEVVNENGGVRVYMKERACRNKAVSHGAVVPSQLRGRKQRSPTFTKSKSCILYTLRWLNAFMYYCF